MHRYNVRINVLHNVSWHGGELSLKVVYVTIKRVVLLYEIIAVVHRVVDDVGTKVCSNACMALAVSIEPLMRLMQKLWHGSATLILGGRIVLDVCPEPLDGLDTRYLGMEECRSDDACLPSSALTPLCD